MEGIQSQAHSAALEAPLPLKSDAGDRIDRGLQSKALTDSCSAWPVTPICEDWAQSEHFVLKGDAGDAGDRLVRGLQSKALTDSCTACPLTPLWEDWAQLERLAFKGTPVTDLSGVS